MISNRTRNLVMLGCLVFLIGVCSVIYTIDSKNRINIDPDSGLEIPSEEKQGNTDENFTKFFAGATEAWKDFSNEIDFDLAQIGDKNLILIKKPEAAGETAVAGNITNTEKKTITFVIENCKYTELTYAALERRSNGYYYNSEPAKGGLLAEDDELLGTLDPANIASDIYGDPLRGFTSQTVSGDGDYNVIMTITLDKEYDCKLYETEGYFLIALSKAG